MRIVWSRLPRFGQDLDCRAGHRAHPQARRPRLVCLPAEGPQQRQIRRFRVDLRLPSGRHSDRRPQRKSGRTHHRRTTEILRNQLYDAMHRGESLDSDFVVIDEAHFLGDAERGSSGRKS